MNSAFKHPSSPSLDAIRREIYQRCSTDEPIADVERDLNAHIRHRHSCEHRDYYTAEELALVALVEIKRATEEDGLKQTRDCEERLSRMRRSDVFSELKRHSIHRDSMSWHDYNLAKQVLIGNLWLPQPTYARLIGWVTAYIGI